MKGVVFNLLEAAVERELGEEAWDGVLTATGLEGVYTSLGDYPDEELAALLGAAGGALGKVPAEMTRWFGERAIGLLLERYPEFTWGHSSTRSFLLTLEDVIHVEVLKVYPDARPPRLGFTELDDGTLLLQYSSQRRLCTLAEGMVEGAAPLFGERAQVEHASCVERGDASCTLRCRFDSLAA